MEPLRRVIYEPDTRPLYNNCISVGFTNMRTLLDADVGTLALIALLCHFQLISIPFYGCLCKTLMNEV